MSRVRKGDSVNGWFLLNKLSGEQSMRSTSSIKRLFNARKAGHGGTLDPFAEGILPIALGEATKTMSFILDESKEYEFVICFGVSTDSYDCDGEVMERNSVYPSSAEIASYVPRMRGEIMQVPPKFSALKVDGRRAYDLAREGVDVKLAERAVTIYDLEFLGMESESRARFSMRCSKGTYVRSFAVDFAAGLGALGHLCYLRRTAVGSFSEKDAILLETALEREHKADMLLPIEAGLDGISVIALTDSEKAKIRNGHNVGLLGRGDLSSLSIYTNGELLLARDSVSGDAIALVEYDSGELKPCRVFNI